ncbi:50S ribosomal protein L3, partial [Candidatus Curtissbacteria bacterium RBG_16_39_7]
MGEIFMFLAILGKKLNMSVRFDKDSRRIPVTQIEAGPCVITQVKNQDKNGYLAVQFGFGQTKKTKKPILGHIKKAGLETSPKFLREIRVKNDQDLPKIGHTFKVDEVFNPGDIVKIGGVSKGKGFTGVVKRWGFAGGPKSHGQSDRERAPGSIGQTTTPGRVHKGKKMAGRTGGEKVTVQDLKVIEVLADKNILVVKGSVPGPGKG